MLTFPLLYTRRLMLRQLSPDDIPALLMHVNNRKITDNIVNFPYPYLEHHAVFRLSYVYQGFKGKSHYVFAIIYRDVEPETFAGEVSLHPEPSKQIAQLGYWIAEAYWNRGIASEAVAEVIRFGFEKLHLCSIYAECRADNRASVKVLANNNLLLQGENNNVGKYVITNPFPEHSSAVRG